MKANIISNKENNIRLKTNVLSNKENNIRLKANIISEKENGNYSLRTIENNINNPNTIFNYIDIFSNRISPNKILVDSNNIYITDCSHNDNLKSDDNLNNHKKLISNFKSWYPNRWIDSFDENGNPIYKSYNNNYDEHININTDLEIYNNEKISNEKLNTSLYKVYDSLISDYKTN